MKCISVFEAVGPIDTNEGRGGNKSYGFYSQIEIAKRAAKGKGVMGTDGEVTLVNGYQLYVNGFAKFVRLEDVHDIFVESPEELKARAKAKLTAALTTEERKALGIKIL